MQIRTLADASVGERLVIGDIIFERTRVLCRDLGIHSGRELRCAARDIHRITLRSVAGVDILLDPFDACFVAIERPPAS